MQLPEISQDLKSAGIPTTIKMLESGIYYLCPKGELALVQAHILGQSLGKLLDSGYVDIIIDLQDVSYASSTGVGMLTNAFNEAKQHGGILVIINTLPAVFSIIHLLGFTSFLIIRDSLDEALKEFTNER